MAVAKAAGKLIGFAYSANNVSGASQVERRLKKLSVVKNYLWLREVSVQPEHQMQGIAHELGVKLLEHANPKQPVATYIWPDEIAFLQPCLEAASFTATGEEQVEIFGPDTEPVRQVRMQAANVQTVLRTMREAYKGEV